MERQALQQNFKLLLPVYNGGPFLGARYCDICNNDK